jgi:hypothetical protein
MSVGFVRTAIALGAACLLGVGAFLTLRSGEEESAPEEEVQVLPHWLAAHQSADGGWEAAGFDAWQMGERATGNDPAGRGRAHNDVAVTALAVLAFTKLGYGGHEAPSDDHPNTAAARWGRHFLRGVQREDGGFADRSRPLWATNHALATLALAESAESFLDPLDAESARRAARFRAAHATDRAWHEERGPGDVPPIAWLALAHGAARTAAASAPGSATGLESDPALERDRREVISWVTFPEETWTVGRVGAALAVDAKPRMEWSEPPERSRVGRWLAEHAPRWNATGAGVDFAGSWLGTMGAFALGRETWKAWDAAIRTAVADTQRMDTGICERRGSWDPLGAWADEGGRVYMTAAGALLLETYYRYDSPKRSSAPPPTPRDLPLRRYSPCR